MNKKNIWRIAALLLVLVLLAVVVIIMSNREGPSPDATEEETQTQEESSQEEESPQEEESTEVSNIVEYPAPEYDFQIEEITVEVPGITQEYTLAWVSDLHMITDHEPADDIMEEFTETISQRYETLFVNPTLTADKIKHSDELWPEIVKYLNYTKIDGKSFDGIIFGGDLLDYCSRSNLDVFLEEYNKLNPDIPKLYIRADHDYGFWYGGEVLTEPMAWEMHMEIDGDDLYDKYLDFEEFVVIGVNRSNKDMSPEQYNIIKQQYDDAKENNKPVIIVTHVPYEAQDDGLREFSMQIRNKVYYWTYFSQEGDNIPNDLTSRYFADIYSDDTQVCNVFAGHMHAAWDGMISNRVSQHIFAPAFMGFIGVIHIVPAAS